MLERFGRQHLHVQNQAVISDNDRAGAGMNDQILAHAISTQHTLQTTGFWLSTSSRKIGRTGLPSLSIGLALSGPYVVSAHEEHHVSASAVNPTISNDLRNGNLMSVLLLV
jgi:hypothetical protein